MQHSATPGATPTSVEEAAANLDTLKTHVLVLEQQAVSTNLIHMCKAMQQCIII